jgi:hypothetical protein
MESNTTEAINKKGFDRRWFAALDLSMVAVAMIVKPRLGFGTKFPAIVASPFVVTAAGHYFDVLPTTTHFVSGIGYSLLTLHALILIGLNKPRRNSERFRTHYYRPVLYLPILVGFAGLNFYQAGKRF